ncbi:MAG TPA: TIGR04086 family membrane protein [Firmicutes bacterium]|nr:TIGR04086 family membrane protein [Bacillota bacterium]
MSQNLGKAVLIGLAFIVSSILILGLIITMFAYFEWFSIGVIEKLVYMTFVLSLFLGTSISAKIVSEKGWLIGLMMGGLFVILTALFYTIGVDAGLTFKVLIRCLIALVICLTGGMVGVNLPSIKR